MKMFQVLMIGMMFGFSILMHADATTSAAGSISIINLSNAPIKFNIRIKQNGHKTDQISTTPLIAPGSTGTLAYNNKDSMSQAWVVYYQADGTTVLDVLPGTTTAVNIVMPVISVPTAIYIYGNNSVAFSSLDTTNTASPMPSRSVAWWSGNINVATDATAQAAIADTANVGKLVSMYMVSLDGKSLLTF